MLAKIKRGAGFWIAALIASISPVVLALLAHRHFTVPEMQVDAGQKSFTWRKRK